jgi:hypothetical protein
MSPDTLSRHHLAGIDADPYFESDAVVALELAVHRFEPGPHVCSGSDRSECIVLVDVRNAEDGHDGVADELLDARRLRRPPRVA